MKADIRVRHTKERIRKAFFQLLKQKRFSKITVTEVCQIAEINRTTFYKHYLDMYDLLRKIEDDILDTTKKLWKRLHPQNSVEEMEAIFSDLQNHQQDYQYPGLFYIFQADPQFSFEISEILCQNVTPNFLDDSYTPQEWAMLHRIMIYGYGSITRNWLLSSQDDKMAPRQLAEFLFQTTEKLTASKNTLDDESHLY